MVILYNLTGGGNEHTVKPTNIQGVYYYKMYTWLLLLCNTVHVYVV